MEFRSVHQLSVDVARWSETLPEDVDLVAGIPRSGMLPATMLALHMHRPLTDLDGLIEGRVLRCGERLSSERAPDAIEGARRILVVDDSTNRGGAIRRAKMLVAQAPHLRGRVVWGAPYAAQGAAEGLLDHWYEKVSRPRAFEWNIMHHSGLVEACVDLDSVLIGRRPDEPLPPAPRLTPGSEVGWLVTSRDPAGRPGLESWLEEHGFRWRHLVMSDDPAHRPDSTGGHLASDPARRKSTLYDAAHAWLFIEGDPDQARAITEATGRPVYCTERRAMLYPGVPEGAPPRPGDAARWRRREAVRLQRRRAQHWRNRLGGSLRRADEIWRLATHRHQTTSPGLPDS
ncbi:phosphoribosyltransferase [Cellulomonas bogoriensis]|uniref:Phosphoribosyltransferase n=1 Tax=Cellulomonas bogoriensis 69B4 = DSM 16987 TaxID=1386082 RepID=A0A0A0C1K7_9CELL|nr:hypothetical protein [Cellulomonas bogoriensis]KGM14075.1 hypothetical protein N869_05600 [Cellulomonas bogoriensis 69B4 = DSM 16987]